MNQELTDKGIGTVADLPGGWHILVVLDRNPRYQIKMKCSTQESGQRWGKNHWPDVTWLEAMDYLTTVDAYAVKKAEERRDDFRAYYE